MIEPWELFKIVDNTNHKTVGDDVDYKVMVIDDHPCLLFQGSRDKRDWVNNFNFPATVYKNQENALKVQRGYVHAWKSCNDEIMKEFIDLYNINTNTPYIAGHSYGGAMSILACEDFYYRTKKKPVVITFGAPKILFGRKTKNYVATAGEFTQYMEYNDFVPFCMPLPGFRHLNKTHIGDRFNLFKLIFKTPKYHQRYECSEDY